MEKKEFLKNIEDIRGKVNKLAIDRLNEQPDEEKGIEKKIPEGCIEIPLSEVSYIYQSPFSHNPTVIMKTHEEVTSKRKGWIDLSKLKDKRYEISLSEKADKPYIVIDDMKQGGKTVFAGTLEHIQINKLLEEENGKQNKI